MNISKRRLISELKRHFIDSTAIVSIATPINATLETMVVGMSDKVSINSRLFGAGITYAGLGSLTKIRDASKRYLGIVKESKQYVKGLHDIAFAGIFVVGTKPLVYIASGESDWKKIGLATFLSTLTIGAIAYPLGYAVDSYRDLTGIESSERLPKFIERQSPKVKKSLATFLTASLVGVAGLVYAFNGQ